jgi:hypothetical protein
MLNFAHDDITLLTYWGQEVVLKGRTSMKGSKDNGQPPPHDRRLRFASLGFRNVSTAAWQRLDLSIIAKSGRKHSEIRLGPSCRFE